MCACVSVCVCFSEKVYDCAHMCMIVFVRARERVRVGALVYIHVCVCGCMVHLRRIFFWNSKSTLRIFPSVRGVSWLILAAAICFFLFIKFLIICLLITIRCICLICSCLYSQYIILGYVTFVIQLNKWIIHIYLLSTVHVVFRILVNIEHSIGLCNSSKFICIY